MDSVNVSFHEDEAIHVAIASLSSPRESYRYYSELLQYIAKKIKIPVHSIQKQSFKEVNQLLLDGAVDFAFIGSGAYVSLDKSNAIKLLAAPVIDNQKHYHAYLIVDEHSNATSFSDLRGEQFAFSDPLSNSGFFYPLSKLSELGESPESFFSKTVFTFGHDFSIEMVNRNIVDGAYVQSLIYDYLSQTGPEKIANTKVIEISEPYGIPPIVCPKTLDTKKFKLYRDILLNVHHDKEGREILKRLKIDRFEEVDDTNYENIRQLKIRVEK
jgi:phosphonate transport system substrate-binding protein